MAIEFVTAYKGNAHVTAADVGAMQQGIFGADDYVLDVGKKMEATLVTNNSIKIADGEVVMQGRHFRIKPDTYENVTIDNGAQGMKRKDLIVWRYTKNPETGVENVELVVLKGTPTAGTPVSPIPEKGDIRTGDLLHEMMLYTVEFNGLNVVGIELACRNILAIHNLMNIIEETNKKMIKTKQLTYTNVAVTADNPLLLKNFSIDAEWTGKEIIGIVAINIKGYSTNRFIPALYRQYSNAYFISNVTQNYDISVSVLYR